jgi:hypothetical protein
LSFTRAKITPQKFHPANSVVDNQPISVPHFATGRNHAKLNSVEVTHRRKMNAVVDAKMWRSAVISGVVSVGLLAAALIPIGMLIAPVSLIASVVGISYGVRSLIRREDKKHLAIVGILLSLVAPCMGAYVVLFVKVA